MGLKLDAVTRGIEAMRAARAEGGKNPEREITDVVPAVGPNGIPIADQQKHLVRRDASSRAAAQTQAGQEAFVADAVKKQDEVRAKRTEVTKAANEQAGPDQDKVEKTPGSFRTEQQMIEQGANDNLALTDREKAAGGLKGDGTLNYTEGASEWIIREESNWTKVCRQLSLPLAAGPSGTTNRLMNVNSILGAVDSPEAMRLACIGYLLPINAHSLVEVCAGAAAHGAPFTMGQGLYQDLEGGGVSQQEILERCGRAPEPGTLAPPGQNKLYPGQQPLSSQMDEGSDPGQHRDLGAAGEAFEGYAG
jgi:hypothetical protein